MNTIQEDKAGRFYFDLGINYILPEKPNTASLSDDEWISARCESLCNNIQKELSSSFDEIQFSRFKLLVPNENVFTIYFSVSKCCDFSSDEIYFPSKDHAEFKIKKHSLRAAKKSVESEIRNLLCEYYFISVLSLKYFASRDFVFKLFFGGYVTVEKIFTQDEIDDAGSVSSALECFSDEMMPVFEDYDLEGWPLHSTRRNRYNKYVFEVTKTCFFGFDDRNVVGNLELLTNAMDIDDARMLGIGIHPDAFDSIISNVKERYTRILDIDMMPEDVELIKFEFDFVDQDEEIVEVCDELLMDASFF